MDRFIENPCELTLTTTEDGLKTNVLITSGRPHNKNLIVLFLLIMARDLCTELGLDVNELLEQVKSAESGVIKQEVN